MSQVRIDYDQFLLRFVLYIEYDPIVLLIKFKHKNRCIPQCNVFFPGTVPMKLSGSLPGRTFKLRPFARSVLFKNY